MKQLQGSHLKSIGTVRNYEQRLIQCAQWLQQEHCLGINHLKDMQVEHALQLLDSHSFQLSQKSLDMTRQAIQAMFQHVTHQLDPEQHLPIIKSQTITELTNRSYTHQQVKMLCEHQQERNALSTKIAYCAGLRAHELLTLNYPTQQPADNRPALTSKFQGREGQVYTVQGKGGLIREVLIPHRLAEQLEQQRLIKPRVIEDRGIYYQQHYNIAGGKSWSSSVSKASFRIFDWSHGAHGLRHSYVQQRLDELLNHYSYGTALATVSQEIGHFRSEITLTYLR